MVSKIFYSVLALSLSRLVPEHLMLCHLDCEWSLILAILGRARYTQAHA